MADRLKRFRLHVVKEIYETERDYTRNLEFTVAVCLLLPRLAAIMLGREVAFVQEGSMQPQKAATPMCYIV